MYNIGVSIVLYENQKEQLINTIKCILNEAINIRLFLIDNSSTPKLKDICSDSRIDYIFNNKNIGYGAAHNIGIKKSIELGIDYHVVMNPDITFQRGTLENIYAFMKIHLDIGSVMPKIYYQDGSLQRLCKLLPTPFDLLGRRFFSRTNWAKKQNQRYELHNFDYDSVLNTPCLSGCFMFTRTSVFEKAGLFDLRFFMYMEDYDLNRRIHKQSKTVFYPYVSIIHGHAKESYRNGKLLWIHMQSAIRYFNKWGWFFDKERDQLNKAILRQINSK